MKAFRSFAVRARLPESLAPLRELACNLRWSWDTRTQDLFRWIDPEVWDASDHDPIRLLNLVGRERLAQLETDPTFTAFLQERSDELNRYLESPRWFQQRNGNHLSCIAYFSPEFGIAEALPQYSGGLGVLAGDHLKAASTLGVPIVGIGLMYRSGYFRQRLDSSGWQQERFPILDPHAMATELLDDVDVVVDMAGEAVHARVWLVRVGRVNLYLLDSDTEPNGPEARLITDRLYGGDIEHRLRQEILLGVGGVRALGALGVAPEVCHTNEGHAGFLGLERVRLLVTGSGLSFDEAVEAVRSGTVFTTHTPVPAGIDRFPRALMERYFTELADECGISFDKLMSVGHFPGEDAFEPFNMAVMGLRLAARSNGVAALHGQTSREMFQGLWPSVSAEDVPIGSVTNGVHGSTWVSPAMDDLYSKYVSPAWDEADEAQWARISNAREDEIWRARDEGREALIDFVRDRHRHALRANGVPAAEQEWVDELLDPRYLTIGFARRFATYKRATLLLSQPDRLKALLLDERRPIQLIFAGKAHPADDLGKAMIAEIIRFAADPTLRKRIAFVADYDIAVARMLYQGSDVWLNTPRRPMEASGTSGEKAALNGALNLSILDGWWDEMFDGRNGWAIASAESLDDIERRDRVEADHLFATIEREIVPTFYDRSVNRHSHEWVAKVKSSIASLAPKVMASRMVREYVEDYYEPSALHMNRLSADDYKQAKALAAWKRRVSDAWSEVKVVDVDDGGSSAGVDLGEPRNVSVMVELGSLDFSDVEVQLLHGAVSAGGEMSSSVAVDLERRAPGRYEGSFICDRSGLHGYTVRVVPTHPDLADPFEIGCVTWG